MICKIFRKIAWEYRRYISFGLFNYKLKRQGKLKCILKKLKLYQPVYLYTKGGSYIIGSDVQFGYDIGGRCKNGYIELQARRPEASIIIGDKVAFNNNCTLLSCCEIRIGNCCRIGEAVQMMDFDGHGILPTERSTAGKIASIEIGNNVWIGNRATLLAGTKIGKNSVVAAGAIVKGVFPPDVLIGGVPAKILKQIGDEEIDAERK